jgi:hypothetical protein
MTKEGKSLITLAAGHTHHYQELREADQPVWASPPWNLQGLGITGKA